MLSTNQIKAVELLFELPCGEIAAKLRIKPETLDAWMQDPEFKQALQDQIKENRQATVRILSRLYLDTCREISTLIHSDDDKNKPKVMLDLLKASGLLKEMGLEQGDPIGALIQRLSQQQEDDTEED
jgi:hypothetical protein